MKYNIQNNGPVQGQIVGDNPQHAIEQHFYTNDTIIQGSTQDTWCTFRNNLLGKLSDKEKEAMFREIQTVIDKYAK